MMERAREHHQYLCFIDFNKVFDCVDREHVDHLEGHRVPTQLMVLLRNMYANQEAAVKSSFGDTEEFDIGKVCERVESCLICYSTSTQKNNEKLWTNGKADSA